MTTNHGSHRLRSVPFVSGLATVAICVFTLSPLVVVLGTSFTSSAVVKFPPDGFSLRWYDAFFHESDLMSSLAFSAFLAFCSCAVALVLAFFAVISLTQERNKFSSAVIAVFTSPIFFPSFVLGFAIFQSSQALQLRGNIVVFILSHVVLTGPYAVRLILIGARELDMNLQRAAATLGASARQIIMSVMLPLLRVPLVAAGIFCFIISFDDVGVSLFLATSKFDPIPVRLFVYMESDYTPIVAAASSVLVLVGVLAMIITEVTVGTEKLFRSAVVAH